MLCHEKYTFDGYPSTNYTVCLLLQSGMPKWRNWQTRTTQNRVGNPHVGSIPTFGTEIPLGCIQ